MSQFIEMFGDAKKVKLGELATFVNGSAFKPEEWSESGLPIVRIQNLTGSGDVYNRYNGDTIKKVIIEPGDILISWSATLGVYIWTGEKALLNQHIFRADIDKEKVDKDFFIYTVQAELNIMGENAHGSTMKHVVKKDFDNTLVAYPSLAEQRRFSVIYKQADKSEFVGCKSQFIEMFWGETNKVPLEEIVIVKDDCRRPINEGDRSEMKDGELYPYYGATGVVDYINDYLTDDELLCIAEDCGNYNAGEESAYIIRGKAWVNNHAHLVKTKEFCDIKYLYYFLKIADLKPYVSGTTRLKLTQKKLKEISVTLPSTDKQKTFVNIAEQADKSEFVGCKSQFIEMFWGETNKVPLEEIVIVKDDCRRPINEGDRSEMKDGELYPYYGATGVVDYINDYLTDDELLCIAEDCGNYNAGEESAYIIRGKAWVNNHAHLVKTKEFCDIKYLYYFLKIADLKPYVSGTTRLKLTQKKLKEISVTLPSTDKQKTFVNIAEQADKSEFELRKSIEAIDQVIKSLINDIK